jgi:hypothetical protein
MGRNEYVCQSTAIFEQIILKNAMAIELSSDGGPSQTTTRVAFE